VSKAVQSPVFPGEIGRHELSNPGILIEDLPKVSLHDHLDGGVRPKTVVELALASGISLPQNNPAALAEWVLANSNSGSLEKYLQGFGITLSVMQTAENLKRIASEFVSDLVNDGVIYAEIRWAPELHTEQGLTTREAVAAVQSGIDAAISMVADSGKSIRVGQILCAMRQNDNGVEIARVAIENRHAGVVGFDIAGPEKGYPASRMAEAFRLLDDEWFPRTVHAGEADGLESIEGALIVGRALRLGHGVRISDDIEFSNSGDAELVEIGEIASWVRDREIALEVCPTSNVHTKAFSRFGEGIENHPFDLLYRLGFRVTVSTDNRLMSGTTLSREIASLVETFGYVLEDILEWQLNAAGAAFLSAPEREELIETLLTAYGELLPA
jgi:adenosine deaminase